ncbi:MAG TPA: glycosyltransferase [Stellaceae bacterium]|jgi:GT2 family glycosyltransferase|nr:glycosyltransferase [Stellaceae bacterium]
MTAPEGTPAVSVVMPMRNAIAFLDQAVTSILTQSFTDFEFIIVDDGSTDGSFNRARGFADPRLRIHAQPATGIVSALNAGIALARAPLIARMDADDIALPDRLQKQVSLLGERPDIAAVGSGYRTIDPHGKPLREITLPTDPDEIRRILLETNCMAHPTMVMRRDAIVRAGGYRDEFPLCEDYDLWLRMSEKSALTNIPEPLLLYREHDTNATWADLERRLRSEVALLHSAALRWDEPGRPALSAATFSMDAGTLRREMRRRALRAAGGAIGERRPMAARAALRIALRQGYMPLIDIARLLRLALFAYTI